MVKLENKLSSREVADMMEMGHPELLRKIEGINKDFRESKIAFSKYWEESSYKTEGNNKTYKEFLITKRGCEFLAHKTTGTKGNLFTDRYMDKFAEMEQYIEEGPKKTLSPMEILELQFQVVREQGAKLKEVDTKVTELEDNMPLFNVECKELQAVVKKIGVKSLGGYKTAAYKDNSLRGKVYSDIQHQLRREFGVNRYEAIKRSQLEKAYEIVNSYQLPMILKDEIEQVNNQMSFEEAM